MFCRFIAGKATHSVDAEQLGAECNGMMVVAHGIISGVKLARTSVYKMRSVEDKN